MARTLHSVLQAHQQQLRDESPWIWLYDFQIPTDPPPRYRLTNYTEQVSFGTNPIDGSALVYEPFPIDHGEIELSREGNLPSIRVSVANATREVGDVIETHGGLLGEPAVVRLVNVAALGATKIWARGWSSWAGQFHIGRPTTRQRRWRVTSTCLNLGGGSIREDKHGEIKQGHARGRADRGG